MSTKPEKGSIAEVNYYQRLRNAVAIRVGRMAKTTRYIPGNPIGIGAELLVDVLAKSGKRYQISCNGRPGLWVDADALEPLS